MSVGERGDFKEGKISQLKGVQRWGGGRGEGWAPIKVQGERG